MSEREEQIDRDRNVSELFTALRDVVAANPHIQEMVRMQERENRQVLLNMSSILRLVEQGDSDMAPEPYEPRVVAGWMTPDVAAPEPAAENENLPAVRVDSDDRLNFFDRAFLRSLKISL